MRWKLFCCFLLTSTAISSANERPKRSLGYIKSLIGNKLFGAPAPTNSVLVAQLISKNNTHQLFSIPGQNYNLLIQVANQKKSTDDKNIQKQIVTPEIAILGTYLGTKTEGETLLAVDMAKGLIKSGVLQGYNDNLLQKLVIESKEKFMPLNIYSQERDPLYILPGANRVEVKNPVPGYPVELPPLGLPLPKFPVELPPVGLPLQKYPAALPPPVGLPLPPNYTVVLPPVGLPFPKYPTPVPPMSVPLPPTYVPPLPRFPVEVKRPVYPIELPPVGIPLPKYPVELPPVAVPLPPVYPPPPPVLPSVGVPLPPPHPVGQPAVQPIPTYPVKKPVAIPAPPKIPMGYPEALPLPMYHEKVKKPVPAYPLELPPIAVPLPPKYSMELPPLFVGPEVAIYPSKYSYNQIGKNPMKYESYGEKVIVTQSNKEPFIPECLKYRIQEVATIGVNPFVKYPAGAVPTVPMNIAPIPYQGMPVLPPKVSTVIDEPLKVHINTPPILFPQPLPIQKVVNIFPGKHAVIGTVGPVKVTSNAHSYPVKLESDVDKVDIKHPNDKGIAVSNKVNRNEASSYVYKQVNTQNPALSTEIRVENQPSVTSGINSDVPKNFLYVPPKDVNVPPPIGLSTQQSDHVYTSKNVPKPLSMNGSLKSNPIVVNDNIVNTNTVTEENNHKESRGDIPGSIH